MKHESFDNKSDYVVAAGIVIVVIVVAYVIFNLI